MRPTPPLPPPPRVGPADTSGAHALATSRSRYVFARDEVFVRRAKRVEPARFLFRRYAILWLMSGALSSAELRTMYDHLEETSSRWPRLGWGLLLLLLIGTTFIAFDAGTFILFLLAVIVVLLLSWRMPYSVFYAFIVAAPMIGWLISLSTGNIQFGERVFGGSIDLPVSDIVALAALAAWAFRILFLWKGRGDREWKPWLPLSVSYGLLVGAHALSVFSSIQPDVFGVIKYTLRPVLFSYVTCIALVVNFLRSRKRFVTTFVLLTLSGTFFALDGFRSLFVGGGVLHRARPLSIFGIYPLGINHNVLAEWLVFTAPIALVLALLTSSKDVRRWSLYAAGFMTLIALLTFARSAWIALGVEALFIAFTIGRQWMKMHRRELAWGALFFSPLLIYMLLFSSSVEVQGSTDTRSMLIDIAWSLFRDHPILGIGAGNFVNRVNHVWLFVYEFGAPLDSHGFIQKIAAETGIVGLSAFVFLIGSLITYLRQAWKILRRSGTDFQAYVCLCAAVLGAFVYQLFNTTYWSPKLWLPVGIALAAARMFVLHEKDRDPDFLTQSS